MIQFGEEVNREVGKAFINLFTLIVMATLVTSYVVNKDVLPIPVLLIFVAVAFVCFVIGVSLLSIVDKNKLTRVDKNKLTRVDRNTDQDIEVYKQEEHSVTYQAKQKRRKRKK